MPRHRGIFNPTRPEPYELSRFRIDNFVRCEACFYMQQVEGISFPSIPGFNLNEATDILLKKDFDMYRASGSTHPFLKNLGLDHIVPLNDKRLEKWTQSLHFGAEGRFNTVHTETNMKVGGGLDDVWFNKKSNEVHVVDYKSTSQKTSGKEITLNGRWKEAYRRQMDFYVWVMRRKGLITSNIGYFLYVDGDRFSKSKFLGKKIATMQFKATLIPYKTNLTWVEPTLLKIKNTLHKKRRPKHNPACEYYNFLKQAK